MVDGGSTDGTCDLIPDDVVLVRGPRGRAVQLNAGAKAARGDIFVFCHADTLLPPGWLEAVEEIFMRYDSIWRRVSVHYLAGKFLSDEIL